MPPPTKYAVRQLNHSEIKYAKIAPRTPTAATIIVPYPRLFLAILSLTKVIPAPSSPASPIPAIKRTQAYVDTSWTNPLYILASEYSRIDPKRTFSRPYFSAITHQTIPPRSNPSICMFNTYSPCARIADSPIPISLNDCTRTIEKRIRSYISTKYPNEATRTSNQTLEGCKRLSIQFIIGRPIYDRFAIITRIIKNQATKVCSPNVAAHD